MTTFEQARAIVSAERASAYPAEADFQVATWGWETSTHWIVLAGSWPEIYGYRDEDDEKYIYTADGPRCLVNKSTGEYIEQWGPEIDFDLPTTPVGTPVPKNPAPPGPDDLEI